MPMPMPTLNCSAEAFTQTQSSDPRRYIPSMVNERALLPREMIHYCALPFPSQSLHLFNWTECSARLSYVSYIWTVADWKYHMFIAMVILNEYTAIHHYQFQFTRNVNTIFFSHGFISWVYPLMNFNLPSHKFQFRTETLPLCLFAALSC